MKNISMKVVFLALFVTIFVTNLIYQEYLYNKVEYKENLIMNNSIVKNAEKLNNEQLKQNAYSYLEKLRTIYIDNKEYEKALNITEVQLSDGGITLEYIYSLVNISEEALKFDKAKQYLEKGFILMDNSQKQAAYLRLGTYELVIGNIDKAIKYTHDALKVAELNKGGVEYEKDILYISKRIDLLNSIKEDFSSKKPYSAYKRIIESDDIIYAPEVCRELVNKYTKQFSESNKTDCESLRKLYEEVYKYS